MLTTSDGEHAAFRGALAVVVVAFFVGCGEGAKPSARHDGPGVRAIEASTSPLEEPWPPYVILRRPPPLPVRYRVVPSVGSPVEGLNTAATAGASIWNLPNRRRFVPAASEAEATLAISWQSARHEGCDPFQVGVDRFAHTVFTDEGVVIHVNRDAPWPHGDAGVRLLRTTLAHELGHVLGLGHVPDPEALMAASFSKDVSRYSKREALALATLLGDSPPSTDDASGVLEVFRGDGSTPTSVIYGFAGADLTAWYPFDGDGDGLPEMYVWRTRPPGVGDLMIIHLDASGQVERMVGPVRGAMPSGLVRAFGVTAAGDRVIAQVYPNGRHVTLACDAEGRPLRPLRRRGFSLPGVVDADGDGVVDRVPWAERALRPEGATVSPTDGKGGFYFELRDLINARREALSTDDDVRWTFVSP